MLLWAGGVAVNVGQGKHLCQSQRIGRQRSSNLPSRPWASHKQNTHSHTHDLLLPAPTWHRMSTVPEGSPDLIAARKVSDFLGTIHHEFTFTVEEGIDALYDLIWHIESYEQV